MAATVVHENAFFILERSLSCVHTITKTFLTYKTLCCNRATIFFQCGLPGEGIKATKLSCFIIFISGKSSDIVKLSNYANSVAYNEHELLGVMFPFH